MYKPKQSKPLGWLLIVVAGVFMIFMAIILLFLPLRGALAGAIQGGGTFLLLFIGIFLIIFGRKKKASLAEEVLAKDKRPPIIYFRPFNIDGTPISGFQALITTYEERLSKALRPLGPFIAIGRPKERIPELGAAKMYLNDESWQNDVGTLAENAALIVLHLGVSEGILWELQTVLTFVKPQQIILSLPMNRRGTALDVETYNEVCEMISTILSLPSPDNVGKARFICFDNDWNPILLKPDKKLIVKDLITGPKTEATELQISVLERINDAFK